MFQSNAIQQITERDLRCFNVWSQSLSTISQFSLMLCRTQTLKSDAIKSLKIAKKSTYFNIKYSYQKHVANYRVEAENMVSKAHKSCL